MWASAIVKLSKVEKLYPDLMQIIESSDIINTESCFLEGVFPVKSASAVIAILRDHQEDHTLMPLMLRPLLFAPAATWLVRTLQDAGVERFLLITEAELAEEAAKSFPGGTQVCFADDPAVNDAVRAFAAGERDEVICITEPVWLSRGGAQLLTVLEQLPEPEEVPAGVRRISAAKLAAEGDLTAGAPFAPEVDDVPLMLPLTDAESFDAAQYYGRLDQAEKLIEQGVRILDPQNVYIDPTVTVGAGTVLLPGTILRGDTHIGQNCEIGPNTMIRDCTLGDGCVANSSQLNEAVFGANVNIGPFAYVRPGTRVADNAKVGDFVEVKNAVIGEGTKLPHLIYVGDSDVGAHCNFGCGSITCNYDGNQKYRTTVGDNVFIGCNTNLVAPVTVEDGAFTAAGSTITDTVPADALAVARARQVHKPGWAAAHRAKKEQK